MQALQVKKTTTFVSYRKGVTTLLQKTNAFLCCLLGFHQSFAQKMIRVDDLVRCYYCGGFVQTTRGCDVWSLSLSLWSTCFWGYGLVRLKEDSGIKVCGLKSEDCAQERFIIKYYLLHLYCLFVFLFIFCHYVVGCTWWLCY